MTKLHIPTAEDHQQLCAIISQVQSRFILAAPMREVFDPLLTDLLSFTGGEYGFLADLERDPVDLHRFLRVKALADIGSSSTSCNNFKSLRDGPHPVEFHDLDTLFGEAVTTRQAVICNDLANDPRSRCRSTDVSGSRAMKSFLGIPLHHGGDLVGVLTLCNREGGYDQGLITFLEPLFASVGAIMGAVLLEKARNEAERALRESQVTLIAAAVGAQHANAAKTEFLTRMSHELRTPLNAVLGFAQLLHMHATDTLTPLQSERVGHIQSAGEHLLAMITDVLDFSAIESGNLPLSLEAVSAQLVVQQAVMLATSLAAKGSVLVRVETPIGKSGHAQARADHLRLRQVMMNLMSNAVKYNRPGGTVTVTWQLSDDSSQVHLEVRDTGWGMSSEQRLHLFEPFNRLGVKSTSVEGIGIGLVISRRLVESMGGEIEVSSELGVGSCFRVILPAVPCNEMSTLPSEPPSAVDIPLVPVVKHTVLYADDNALNVEVVLAILGSRPDLRAVIARDGREAIEVAQRERPDLLLLDMHLGDMTGFDVKLALELDPLVRLAPCIVVSADAMPTAIARAKEAGFRAYLTKPLNVKSFLHSIDEALSAE